MITIEDTRKNETSFIQGNPYDVMRHYEKTTKIFGITIFKRTLHHDIDYTTSKSLQDKPVTGFKSKTDEKT